MSVLPFKIGGAFVLCQNFEMHGVFLTFNLDSKIYISWNARGS